MSLLCLMALASVGCQNKLYEENVALRRQVLEYQDQNRQLQSELGGRPQQTDLQTLQGQLAERDKQIADLQTQINKPAPGEPKEAGPSGFGNIEVTRDARAGTITVNVPGDVLFASGDATVKASAKGTLDKIANVLKKDFPGKKVYVEGHTDTDPIVRSKWKDNLELSAARARAVADVLKADGITAGPRAMGDTQPKASKDKSRRVEIVVVTK
jgi:flagellar motor protein MotB